MAVVHYSSAALHEKAEKALCESVSQCTQTRWKLNSLLLKTEPGSKRKKKNPKLMDFMVQLLATDKKWCIFSGTIFRILLNLVSCDGFKEGIYFFLTVKRRKQLQHYNSVATLPRTASAALTIIIMIKKKRILRWLYIFQHRHLTGSVINAESVLGAAHCGDQVIVLLGLLCPTW